MFLPTEGLYAEAVNLGLVEVLQREYKINIAGPSTMAAMLNSFLQMVSVHLHLKNVQRSLASLRRSQGVNLKNSIQFLKRHKKRITQTGDELDKLIGVRMRAMERKLRSVEKSENNSFDDML